MFSLLGFESIASLYRVVTNPARNVPRAAIYSVTIVSSLYALFVCASMAAVDKTLFSGGVTQAFSHVLAAALPSYAWLSGLITVGAVFAIVGTLHSMLWSIAELFLDVMRKGKSCSIKPIVDAGWLNPTTSALIIGAATAVCTYFINAGAIMVVATLPIVSVYFVSVLALLFNRRILNNTSDFVLAVGAALSSGWLCWLSLQAIISLF
jgi:amino acid transporter